MRTHSGVMLLAASLGAVVLSGTNCPMNPPPPPPPTDPVEFTNADLVRGGKLYTKWWEVNGAAEPTGNHPRYPTAGMKSGSTTWRCKECHGWDYKGKDGAYATGSSHFTGIKGLFGTTKTAQEVFDAIKTHNMPGLADADMWDLAKFVLGESSGDKGAQFDTDTIINAGGVFNGNATTGKTLYDGPIGTNTLACTNCHGADGKTINFGDAANPEFVGTIAAENPWEFQHHVRVGHPGTPMPSSITGGGSSQDVADVGAYAAGLPTM